MIKGLAKAFWWLVSVAIFGGLLFFWFGDDHIFETSTNKTSESALIQEQLVPLSEWTTLKYEYSNVIISRTERSFSLPVVPDLNYAEAIRLIEYSGYLKAGTDLSKLIVSPEKVSSEEGAKKISVRLPKSQILDNVVETEKATVEDVKGTIFSDYPTQMIIDEINKHKQQLEEEKISQGFLEEADERARALLTTYLKADGYDIVEIEFY